MIYGIIKTTKYELIANSWRKVEAWTETNAILDRSHWQTWANLDNGRLRSQCGYMLSYVSYSPDHTEKVKVEYLRMTYKNRLHEALDKLNNLSDKDFNKLYKRAKATAEANNIDFEKEACFISSSNIHGFYFPNLTNYRVIAFCKGEAVLLTNAQVEENGK